MRPTSPLSLARPFGKAGRGRVEEQAWRAYPVAGEHHHPRRLAVLVATPVVEHDAIRATVCVYGNLPHARMGHEAYSLGEGGRPVGDVGTGHGADRAAHVTRPTVVTHATAVTVWHGNQRTVRRPPMPAQLLQPTDVDLAGAVEAERRRLPGLAGRVSGIAAQARDPDHRVVLLVVRLQVPVGQGPVVGDAIEGVDAEVRGAKAGKVPAPVDGAAADGIEHERDNRRPVHVDGIVFRALAYIRVLGKIGGPVVLPIGPVVGIRLRVNPAALLQADDG